MKLYSQPSCPQCKMVHMLLDKKGIKYEECQDMGMMEEIGIRHTPTLEIEVEVVDENGVTCSTVRRMTGKEIMDYIKNRGIL